MKPRTLYRRIVDAHTVRRLGDAGQVLLYVDRQVLNEYTSPQAFAALHAAGRLVWRPASSTIAVVDHVNPTTPVRNARTMMIADAERSLQVKLLQQNCEWHGIALYDMLDEHQGIEHIVASEQGLVLPGMVMAAGDSHTTTHGAMGALGFGIGSSEIEHLLATQTLVYTVQKSMRVDVWGRLGAGVTAKDLVLELIRRIGADGATGHVIEYTGAAIRALGVEGRLTLCNMSVEAAARGAIVAPDDTLFDYLHGRERVPKGVLWDQAVAAWRGLRSEDGAEFDASVTLDGTQVQPMVTWGTSPDQGTTISQAVPDPADETDPTRRRSAVRALEYMGLQPGQQLEGLPISHAFIGSCTNGRIEDLRDAARVLRGRRVAAGVRALVVPGSTQVRMQAEAEGLAEVFRAAGFEWRQAGCSMCVAMNDDHLIAGDRCASSTNRNFEGRQGPGARTHLMSPAMVAAAAVTGALADVRKLMAEER
ncbi:3-isopropylmalate dehydratase large subunit [Ramlibacter montanisoli]|uniref:3-isopropylmalate dehydratase large subunit n=1 Tax=Ramlibacter montanisoli TaxID=2732512 RepID=A0A849KFU9_9BURK|nr:3-isopropylmalate dehydratase large subunit [Ramlibacter montanisoli]NNU44336.1 3-isopropylmalate dehydratase large subunit [Ramlibacter montanisoli]